MRACRKSDEQQLWTRAKRITASNSIAYSRSDSSPGVETVWQQKKLQVEPHSRNSGKSPPAPRASRDTVSIDHRSSTHRKSFFQMMYKVSEAVEPWESLHSIAAHGLGCGVVPLISIGNSVVYKTNSINIQSSDHRTWPRLVSHKRHPKFCGPYCGLILALLSSWAKDIRRTPRRWKSS